MRGIIKRSRIYIITFVAALLFFIPNSSYALPQAAAPSGKLTITGDIPTPLSLSLDDLKHQPRTTLKIASEHQLNNEDVFEGVALADVLKQAGAPQGSKIKGAALATYLVAEGADGYRVVFSIAEVDSDFPDSGIIVADTMNGAPLAATAGLLRLVVPRDKRAARSVRMLQSIKIVSVPK